MSSIIGSIINAIISISMFMLILISHNYKSKIHIQHETGIYGLNDVCALTVLYYSNIFVPISNVVILLSPPTSCMFLWVGINIFITYLKFGYILPFWCVQLYLNVSTEQMCINHKKKPFTLNTVWVLETRTTNWWWITFQKHKMFYLRRMKHMYYMNYSL